MQGTRQRQIDQLFGQLGNISAEISQWFSDFQTALRKPDERGNTDRLLYALKQTGKIAPEFSSPGDEKHHGHDFTLEFHVARTDKSAFRSQKTCILFVQAKNMELVSHGGEVHDIVRFIDGNTSEDGRNLQVQKLHATIYGTREKYVRDDDLEINGGYIIYGPAQCGVLYVPIGTIFSRFDHPDGDRDDFSDTAKNIAITRWILNNWKNFQLSSILGDVTQVPKFHFWFRSDINHALNCTCDICYTERLRLATERELMGAQWSRNAGEQQRLQNVIADLTTRRRQFEWKQRSEDEMVWCGLRAMTISNGQYWNH